MRPKDAEVSGLLAGPIAMIPAFLFFFAMVSRYPQVNAQHIPIVYMLEQLKAPTFDLVFQAVIFGTLVEAGSALIRGFNERIADTASEKRTHMPAGWRTSNALRLMCVSTILANKVGIVDLIAKTYGYSTYVFLIALPLLSRGLWLISRHPNTVTAPAQTPT